jgi:hypothetical protein
VRTVEQLHGDLPDPTAISYDDVNDGDVHARAVAILTDVRIVTGYPDGMFGPHDPIRRDQTASYMSRWLTGHDRP